MIPEREHNAIYQLDIRFKLLIENIFSDLFTSLLSFSLISDIYISIFSFIASLTRENVINKCSSFFKIKIFNKNE